MPERVLEGWTSTLKVEQFNATDIIELYADHGTHEQFHSEFKTDLDLGSACPRASSTPTISCAILRPWQ